MTSATSHRFGNPFRKEGKMFQFCSLSTSCVATEMPTLLVAAYIVAGDTNFKAYSIRLVMPTSRTKYFA